MRAAVTSLTLIARGGHPTGTFASVDEAAAWLAPHLAPSQGQVTRYDIVNAVKTLRR